MAKFNDHLKLYIKEKSTKNAFYFFVSFLVLFIISFIPSLNYRKGVRNDFSMEKISFMSSNGTDTTYLVSKDNHLFYSLYKNSDISHLNKYTGTKNLANEYSDPTFHLDNFIYVDYDFDSNIIKVDGETDYRKGYTLVLTKSGKLYYLDNNSVNFEVIASNIKSFTKMYTNLLIKTFKNDVSYIDLSKDSIENLSIDNIESDNFFFSDVTDESINYYYEKDNSLYYKEIKKDTKEVIKNENQNISNISSVSCNGSASIIISNNNIIGIDDKNHTFSNNQFTSIEQRNGNIKKVYSSGEFSFIFDIDGNNYYLGKIYNDSIENYTSLINLNNNYEYFYSGNYSTIILEKDRLYSYNRENNKYEAMYINYFVKYVLKYLSLFVCVGIVFYFIYSFFEANERYNRYFKEKYRKEMQK